jgi:hypothetical protein
MELCRPTAPYGVKLTVNSPNGAFRFGILGTPLRTIRLEFAECR